MRIISGKAGGRRLIAPRGSSTRPTSDRVRESLFSRLDSLGALSQARVLDLFAGSGALGLEALSRGAASLVSVEHDRSACTVLDRNVTSCGFSSVTEVVKDTVGSALTRTSLGGPFHLVFADPPYDVSDAEVTDYCEALVAHVEVEAVVVLERSARSQAPQWPSTMQHISAHRYGETAIYLGEYLG